MAKSGWDKPLDIKILWNINGLKSALYRKVGTGPLGSSMRVTERGRGSYVNITNDKPYAEIQDVGGVIPPFQSEAVMRFEVAGKVVFTRKRAQIIIKPKRYTERAVDIWYKTIGVEWK